MRPVRTAESIHERPGARRAPGRFVFVALAAALWTAAQTEATTSQALALVLSCQAIAGNTSVADLRARYGAANVVGAPATPQDGASGPGTVLYPSSPEHRIEIQWADASRTRLASFTAYERKSAWRTPEGLRMGTPIAEVELANGRSFILEHFNRDRGGAVLSWAGGKLAQANYGPCGVFVRLAPPDNQEFTTAELKLVDAIASSVEVASDDRRIKPYKAAVIELGLEWRN